MLRDGRILRGYLQVHAEAFVSFHSAQSSGRFLLSDREDGAFDLVEQ